MPLAFAGRAGFVREFGFPFFGELVELDDFGGKGATAGRFFSFADDVDLVESFPAVGELKILVVDGSAEGFGFAMGGRGIDGDSVGPVAMLGGGNGDAIYGEGVVAGSEIGDDEGVALRGELGWQFRVAGRRKRG